MNGILAPRPRPNPRRGGVLAQQWDAPPSGIHTFDQELYGQQAPMPAAPPGVPPEMAAAPMEAPQAEQPIPAGPDGAIDLEQIDSVGKGAPQGQPYQVQRGDTLWEIAQGVYGNGVFWEAIAAANGITDPRQLQPGQTIIIPDVTQMGADASAPEGPMGMARGNPMAPVPRPRPGPGVPMA